MAFSLLRATTATTAAAAFWLAVAGVSPGASAFVPSSLLTSAKQKRGAFLSTTAAAVQRRRLLHASSSDRLHRLPYSHLFAASAEAASAESTKEEETKKKIPIHLLAGFLGSGKTTTLQHLLQNTSGLKIGVIVNDVASVNIDAKLVNKDNSNSVSGKEGAGGASGIVELQNGCACCSLSGEFVDSVGLLLDNMQKGNSESEVDAVVVELSGVADPVAVQNTWRTAVQTASSPRVTSAADITNVITLVDACTFGTDYFTWDQAKDRPTWFSAEEEADCAGNRKVTELLAEQVEAANVVLINKLDIATEEQVKVTKGMVSSLNEEAVVMQTEKGVVDPEVLLKDYTALKKKAEKEEEGHSHDHDHATAEAEACDDPDCTDDSHSHAHSHDHEASAAACSDPECTDESHSHSHSHDSAACTDPDCTDASHSHSHSHDHDSSCTDPDCTDASHSHSHDHADTSTDALGISNFVYKASRPFDPNKLQSLLLSWPVPIKNVLDLDTLKHHDEKAGSGAAAKDTDAKGGADMESSPFEGVLRSKGFCWFAPTSWTGLLADPWRHDTAMYWSHAGKHMGIQEAGRWWHSLPPTVMEDFFKGNEGEFKRILKEDFVSEEWGDRRQELVFIGVDLLEDAIRQALDECLLSEEDMEDYRAKLKGLLEAIEKAQAAEGAAT